MVHARAVLHEASRGRLLAWAAVRHDPLRQDMVFANPGVQERFDMFKQFIRGRENDSNFLEAAASLHVLHRTSGMPRADIVKKVAAKQDHFDEEYCNDIWDEMTEKWRLVE